MAKPIRDPLLKRVPLGPDEEPSESALLKDAPGRRRREPDTGAPTAGRSTLAEASARGPLGWLQLLGPGLITGASDDDPSGIGTYSQVGAQFGLGLIWTALFTFPLMLAVQELCARIALETGVGLGAALRKKFDARLIGFCIAGLCVANTINVGADLGAVAAGGSLLSRHLIPALALVVPAAALVLGLQLFVTYDTIFKIFKWLTVALFAYVITLFIAHPSAVDLLRGTFVPQFQLTPDFSMALVAVLGTTISPYLFFWQASSEIDVMRAAGLRRPSDRRHASAKQLQAARIDIAIGMFFSQVVMYAIIATSASVLHVHGQTNIATADQAAAALRPLAGPLAFVLFAVGMIGTGLLAVPILSGSAAYAVREFAGFQGALGARPWYRPTFYLVMMAAVLVGVAMNLLHIDAVKALFYTAVINGVVAPPLLVLIVLLGRDRALMRKRVSGRLSTVLTVATTGLMSVAALVMLAFIATGKVGA
jgi:NRAMP (natural resistance-associated macrophage protein)-like metal ion transporter